MAFTDCLLAITSEILLQMIVGAATTEERESESLSREYFRIYFEKIYFNCVIDTVVSL